MDIAKSLQPPDWISSGAVITGGLDLLGLRLPVQFIGGTLLDGVTTVTPSVRYLALRAWLILRYGQTGKADSWQAFTDFAARIESALVLSNLVHAPSLSGLIGSEEALERLALGEQRVQISSLVKSPASTIYTGPSDQLGISKTRENAVPGLVFERGLPLAQAVNRRLEQLPIVEHLLLRDDITEVSIDDLRGLGAVVRIDQIPDDERDLLLAAIVPDAPLPNERARIGTYASLLALASKLKAQPSESNFFDAVCSADRFGVPLIDPVADGWATYCVRDAIAVTQESVLAAVMGEIQGQPDGGLAGANREAVIAALMERVEEHDSALRDLSIIASGESVTQMRFRDLEDRLRTRLSVADGALTSLARWPGKLIEPALYRRALKSGAGAPTLAVVAWIMAAIRVRYSLHENAPEYGGLSYQGWRRQGMRDVVLPELERLRRENPPLREVAAELAFRAVQQHLQITWSRLQVDLRRDVALLTAEGNRWFARGKGFAAGRTASRIQQALGWLSQLKLIDSKGITDDGKVVLMRAFRVLAEGTAT